MKILLPLLVIWISSLSKRTLLEKQNKTKGPWSQNPTANTRCTDSCWPAGSVYSSSRPSTLLRESTGIPPGSPWPWLSPPEPCNYAWYPSDLLRQYHWCLCGKSESEDWTSLGSLSFTKQGHSVVTPQSFVLFKFMWRVAFVFCTQRNNCSSLQKTCFR